MTLAALETLKDDAPGIPYAADHGPLFAKLRDIAPELDFRIVHERGGWHRIGGVVTRDGARVAADLRRYAETEFDEITPDMDLPENWDALLATRFDGRTLYIIAPMGDQAWDFVQLEIEVVQEVIDRELFPDDFVAADIEEFLDPADPVHLAPEPVGEAGYRFHGLAHIGQFIEGLDRATATDRRFTRFLEDWQHSRAGKSAAFHENWALRLFRYTDRFGEQKIEASPLCARGLPALPANGAIPTGAALSNLLEEYDRAAGYPMAWYFQVLTAQKGAHAIAEQAWRDHESGEFAYLPEPDLNVLRAWWREPYCF